MEFTATGIQKVHVQGAQTDSDHWRYVLQWERLTRGSAEVRAACAALLQRLPIGVEYAAVRHSCHWDYSGAVACSLWHVAQMTWHRCASFEWQACCSESSSSWAAAPW